MNWSSETIRRLVRCSACQGKIGDRSHINLVQLGLKATWQYPTAGNVITGESGEAVAIICDRCVEAKRSAVEAVEIAGETVTYHPVGTLAKKKCEVLRRFFDSQFPDVFHEPWSEHQLFVLGRLEERAFDAGGRSAVSVRRGQGATSFALGTAACLVTLGAGPVLIGTVGPFAASELEATLAFMLNGETEHVGIQSVFESPAGAAWRTRPRLVIIDSPFNDELLASAVMSARLLKAIDRLSMAAQSAVLLVSIDHEDDRDRAPKHEILDELGRRQWQIHRDVPKAGGA